MKQYRNEEAVSPVIGVILMVAITVILAAVIAAFVFGMAGNVAKTKNVAFTASKGTGSVITITNNGGQDVGTMQKTVNITGAFSNGTQISDDRTIGTTGATTMIGGTSGKDHVIVTAWFNDGSQQVVLDSYL